MKITSLKVLIYWLQSSICSRGFLQTIGEVGTKNLNYLIWSNNKIIIFQCFFLERAQQLLAPDSVMGVIVPSSILSNGDTIHIATRETLQYFDFLSIVELGSQTFGRFGYSGYRYSFLTT